MIKTLKRWALPSISAIVILATALPALAQSGWSSPAAITLSSKGTNYVVVPPSAGGLAPRLTSFSATTTDADDWLVWYTTGAEASVVLTNLVSSTNAIVNTTNGFYTSDYVLVYSATGKVWSVEQLGLVTTALATNAASVVYSNTMMLITNVINYRVSQNPLRSGDRIYRLVQGGKMGLAAPVTTFGLTNAQGGWTYVQRDGNFWVGNGGKPAVLMLRDESPGAAIVAGLCTNTIYHASGNYIPAN
jgi:hypothetical protein